STAAAYYGKFMLTAGAHPSNGWLACWFALFAFFAELCLIPGTLNAQQPEILPLSQVKPGMQGYAYTIFTGDKIEKFDLEVLGVLANLLGPKQAIILVELKGPKVEHTGVVAGMSGSPVYIEGKLVGALSLRFGIFTKEPLAGVTPIENVLEVQSAAEPQKAQRSDGSQALETSKQDDGAQGTQIQAPVQYAVTAEFLPR